MREGWELGTAKKPRVGEMRSGEPVIEEETLEGGVMLGTRVAPLVEAGEEIRRRKGQGGGKNWEGMQVDGDQYKRLGQVETGESSSPNQIVVEKDGRRRGKMVETQVGSQVGVVGGTGMMVLPGEPGEPVAQGEEGAVVVGWVLLGAWGPSPIKIGVEETKCTRCQTACQAQ